MCGIAGVMMRQGAAVAPSTLDALVSALRHRGPDGSGRHLAGDVGLVQTRLAIIDLQTGDQPLYEPGGAALVANGEIYNYVELRQQMADTPFQTQSDCEVPLWLYRRDGVEFANDLRGMYAIAIHDPAEAKLVLARDPFGIKPLYYVERDDLFAFASEPQALIAAGLVEPGVEDRQREELLQLQFTTGGQTIFRGIKRVLPGETVVVRGGRIVERRRRQALPTGGPEQIGMEDAVKRLDTALTDSVMVHQRSDVPYGLFLSGGIDSSAILALMAKLNDQPVVAFTAGFSGGKVHDERDHARMLAKKVNAEHHEVDFGEEDFWSLLPRVAAAVDDPAADYAILPTWKLAQTAAQGLKVILSGEGGDEIFAGYGRYRSVLRPWFLGGRTIRHRGNFHGLDVLRENSSDWRDGIATTEAVSHAQGRSKLQAAQAVDAADWLSNDLLTKLDRCLMAHGLEGRTPFLDPVVAEAAFRLPDGLKIRKGLGKYVLRQWLNGVMPEAEPFSRKRGFTVPVGGWIAAKGERLGELVEGQEAIGRICKPGRVKDLFAAGDKHKGFAAWVLLFYALWSKHHIEGVDIRQASVFEALAAR